MLIIRIISLFISHYCYLCFVPTTNVYYYYRSSNYDCLLTFIHCTLHFIVCIISSFTCPYSFLCVMFSLFLFFFVLCTIIACIADYIFINARKKNTHEISYHLQFLISDIKTARPRIPSPLTGAIFLKCSFFLLFYVFVCILAANYHQLILLNFETFPNLVELSLLNGF